MASFRRRVQVEFEDGKILLYNSKIEVQLGDKVKVAGKYADRVGEVVLIEGPWSKEEYVQEVTELVAQADPVKDAERIEELKAREKFLHESVIRDGCLIKWKGTDEALKIPQKCIKSVGSECIEPVKNKVKEIILPEGLESVAGRALYRLSQLESIHFPSTLKTVKINDGGETFDSEVIASCSKLKKVTIAEGAKYCPSISDCKSLESVTIPDSVRIIGGFSGCVKLKSIDLPEGLKKIPDYAFSGCERLKELCIPKSVEEIGNGAFKNCSKLTKLQFSDALKSIGDWAFNWCISLKEITLGNGLVQIRKFAFDHTAIQKIVIPDSVKELGENLFDYSEDLKEVILPKTLERIPDAMFYWCKSLEKVVIPSTVKKIGMAAFYNCQSLQEIQLPDGLQIIYDNAFGKCSALKGLCVPKNAKVLDTNGQESSLENLLAFNA